MYCTRSPYFIPRPFYFDTSLFQNIEIIPIDLEFNNFLVRTSYFLELHFFQCFFTSKHSKTISLYFPT